MKTSTFFQGLEPSFLVWPLGYPPKRVQFSFWSPFKATPNKVPPPRHKTISHARGVAARSAKKSQRGGKPQRLKGADDFHVLQVQLGRHVQRAPGMFL